MKKNLLLLTVAVFPTAGFSQAYFYDNRYYDNLLLIEAGASSGAINCITDLGGKPGKNKPFFKDINWNCTKPCAGAYFNLLYRYTVGLRLEATIGNVNAADSLLKKNVGDAVHRYQRNLHFRSRIAELSLLVEFHPLSLLSDPYEFSVRLSPYLLAGIGLFSFNPEARYHGQWISLQPLRTEGLLYKTIQLDFPAGCGLKYEISALFNTRLEFVYRFLQTDYLDDVSTRYIDPAGFYRYFDAATAALAAQLADRRLANATSAGKRGNPKNKDAWFSLNLNLGVALNRKRI